MKKKLAAEVDKRKKLKHSELFVLDNSLRESTVGQLRGHTLENKWKIYEEVGDKQVWGGVLKLQLSDDVVRCDFKKNDVYVRVCIRITTTKVRMR